LSIKIKQIEIMTLTAKEIKALETLNRKGNFYTFIEVVNADGTTRSKCVKTTEVSNISANTKEINREETFKVEEVKMMSASERVAIEEANIAMRNNARKNNL